MKHTKGPYGVTFEKTSEITGRHQYCILCYLATCFDQAYKLEHCAH